MKGVIKIRNYFIIALILIFLAVFLLYWLKMEGEGEKAFILLIRMTYENRGENAWFLRESDRTMGLFMNNSWQTVYLVSTSHPIERFGLDSNGNPIILLNLTKEMLLPGERVSYSITYKLIFRRRYLPSLSEVASGTLNDISEDLRRKYCGPTSFWQSNLSILENEARRIVGTETKVLTILRWIIRWIASNIIYAPSEIPKYPIETFSSGLGDCDDQSNLLITLCRIVGIPAYLQLGCIYVPHYNQSSRLWSEHLSLREYGVSWHGWAMVYVPPWGWLPVDPTCVSSVLLRTDQLNAILCSAVMQYYTFQYMNITVADYIAETRNMKVLLESNGLYVCRESVMEEVKSQSPPQIKIPMLPFAIQLLWAEKISPAREFKFTAKTYFLKSTQFSRLNLKNFARKCFKKF